MAATDFALLIGNGDYGTELTRLQGPSNDVAAFAEWLVDPAGGDVPPGQVFALCDGGPALPAGVLHMGLAEHHAIYNNFFSTDAAAVALTAGASPRPRRRLWLLFAGHGNMPARQYGVDAITACFVAQDWGRKPAFKGRVVPVEYVRRWIDAFEEFDEVVVFMDCCRSEEPETLNPANPMGVGLALAAPLPRQFVVLCACQADRLAFEAPMDGPGSPVRGVFSMAVLDGLRELRDGKQRLSLGLLRDYVLSTYADRYKGSRTAPLPDLLDEEASRNFILIGGQAPQPPVTFRLRPGSPEQFIQIENGAFEAVAGFRLTAAPVTIPLPIGVYVIRNVSGALIATFEHNSAQGDDVHV